MKTLMIDCDYPIENAIQVSFDSPVSCFDYDIIMWDVGGTHLEYKDRSTSYQGLPSLSDANSLTLLKAMERRRKEFAEILSMGRAVIIFPSVEASVYIATGEKRVSGTGKNAKTTRIVKDFSLYNALPFKLETTAANGLAVEPVGAQFSTLWRATRGYWLYHCILDTFPGEQVARIANTDKVIGSIQRSKEGGLLAILPEPYWEEESYEEEDISEPPTASAGNGLDDHNSTPELLHAWVCEQMSGEAEKAPAWLASYTFPQEDVITEERLELQEQMELILTQIDAVKARQESEDRWKRLIYTQGETLEKEVTRALSELGFTMLPSIPGRADIRAEVNGKRVVIEVKGLAKSAAEKNAAQLEKWVSEETIAGDASDCKPVLIVNAWRGHDLDERTQAAFPDQMLAYCKNRGHCLITTSQLLAMVRTALDDPASREGIRAEILSTVGPVTGWDLTAQLIKKTSTQSS